MSNIKICGSDSALEIIHPYDNGFISYLLRCQQNNKMNPEEKGSDAILICDDLDPEHRIERLSDSYNERVVKRINLKPYFESGYYCALIFEVEDDAHFLEASESEILELSESIFNTIKEIYPSFSISMAIWHTCQINQDGCYSPAHMHVLLRKTAKRITVSERNRILS